MPKQLQYQYACVQEKLICSTNSLPTSKRSDCISTSRLQARCYNHQSSIIDAFVADGDKGQQSAGLVVAEASTSGWKRSIAGFADATRCERSGCKTVHGPVTIGAIGLSTASDSVGHLCSSGFGGHCSPNLVWLITPFFLVPWPTTNRLRGSSCFPHSLG